MMAPMTSLQKMIIPSPPIRRRSNRGATQQRADRRGLADDELGPASCGHSSSQRAAARTRAPRLQKRDLRRRGEGHRLL